MRTLENAVVVITGASRGIGHAIAEELGFSGAKVVVDYAHSKESAEELVAKLVAGGAPGAIAIQADVSDPEQAARLIEETIKHFGRIDVLVNNAGINVDRSLKNMTVVAGEIGNFGQSNYSAAKAGILGLTKAAALELARYNVTVNALCPGPVSTEMWDTVPPEGKEAILKKIPLGRACTPEEVARAVRYLIVDGEYMTGSTLDLNGGWLMT